ncbi:integrator complex subunit 4-like [Dendroctonus ponderosae]|uniref:integrator complex subunit 4 n=1 Tax=Dendroctonus ponderosae TaxID=77166 RepID=UPI002035DA73|nr:integrator complex subunit 4 [Dendroctonus ponderosae]XP_048522286.1 integrator complex subunit 4-like [Dendroctonus ponderosae]XP_048522287.1 integrator complex subunit 4-like [Dendroctonus ponderosae]XP_048523003.1 integrator complex subunit 4-like [Dendroctonus ponderosae]
MAAVLKKRALAEYSQTVTQDAAHLPTKRLKLVKKPLPGAPSSLITVVNALDECKTSDEFLLLLLSISDSMQVGSAGVIEVLKKLVEHFKNEAESAVRVKILMLLTDIGLQNVSECVILAEEIINLIKNDTSHKVLAQGMNAILKLGMLVPESATSYHQKLVDVAKNYLKDSHHAVKCKCLEIIGTHVPLCSGNDSDKLFHLISSYFNNQDARLRSQAFSTVILLYERGFKVNPNIYVFVSDALKDDYEIVRSVALKLIWILGNAYPDNEILVPGSVHEIRLIDDAFGKICNGVTDLSMQVRTLACELLGTMKQISPKFLTQTLDKKLMSNMRRKRTAHELAWENVTSGEWASGKKWADDAPKELLKADSISLMSSGACGAFVHGLEDEFLEVRSAAVKSLCQLSISNPHFANMALDFMVDMFNDEIEDVRLKAIDSLREISAHIILRDDQLETILGALEDFSQEVREGLHRMLATCKMSTMGGLKMCVEKLLDNLKRYPQDKRSTYRCLQSIGRKHPELVVPLVPHFLSIHPFCDMAEPDVENPHYICHLILILNAAENSGTIISLLEPHTLRHYAYLRDTMPQFVPVLSLSETTGTSISRQMSVDESLAYLNNVISNLDVAETMTSIHISLLEMAKEQLNRLSEIDESVSGTAQFTALYIGAQLQILQILDRGFWVNPATLATQQQNTLKTNIQILLEYCLKLQFFFVGLNAEEQCAVKQFRLRALALNLVYIVKGSNSSALAPCHHFLTAVEEMQKDLSQNNIQPDGFTSLVFRDLSQIEEPKPGAVSRILTPILLSPKIASIPRPNINIRMSSANIIDPSGQGDTSLKFTAGLIMSVPFEAELTHLLDPSRIRLKIKYPDQRTQVVVPKPTHLKPLHYDTLNKEPPIGYNIRLLSSVLVSHQVWSEACNVEMNIALCVPEADIGKRKSSMDSNPTMLDLCAPVRVSIAPKPIKKTL